MQVLHKRFQLISDADNVEGVVIVLTELSAGTATIQSLRLALKRLQSAGKEVVVYSPLLDLAHYFVAAAADRIVVPPSSNFEVLGIHADSVFLKDALERLGIAAEVVQISPYKTGFDNIGKSDMSEQYREQIDWILDDTYEYLVSAIADGRGITAEAVKSMIDGAPYTAAEALERGLIDDIAYEDSLAYLLVDDVVDERDESSTSKEVSSGADDQKRKKKAKMAPWPRARGLLLSRYRRPSKQFIGVITIEGAITPGASRRPPINLPIPIPFMGSASSGEETIVQMLRLAEKDSQMGALIIHVDSPGGVHLAADLIWRQIAQLADRKPVVCHFGNVAASGGYYVAAPAAHIVAPELTITGSIGVYSAHISAGELYDRLGVNRVLLSRGERALIRSDAEPLNEDARKIYWEGIVHAYNQFKRVVADGRNLEYEELDPVCEGRVWTGRQALEHKLVDSHGDFVDALQKAAELAEIPLDENHKVEDVNIYPQGRSYLLPRPFEQVDDLVDSLAINRVINEYSRPLAMLPFELRIW